jgi:type I restriction enzyme S subunit
MKLYYKSIGKYIREVKVRNENSETNNLLGININKYFMPSVANIVGTDISVYKIVKKGQFACNRMHVGRDMRLPVALSASEDDFIVSPTYDVFEIEDTTVL